MNNFDYKIKHNHNYKRMLQTKLSPSFNDNLIMYKQQKPLEKPIIRTQSTFAKHVGKKYNDICLITQTRYSLEAAHIIDRALCTNKNQYLEFNIANGILLKTDLHTLFDKNIWCFNPLVINEYNDDTITMGTIWDINSNIPDSIKKGKFNISKASYNLIYTRFVDFLFKKIKPFEQQYQDTYQYIKNLKESLEQNVFTTDSLDDNGYLYDKSQYAIMIDAIDIDYVLDIVDIAKLEYSLY